MKNPTERHDITVAVRLKADDYSLLANMIGTLGCKRMSDVIRLCLQPSIEIQRQDAIEALKKKIAKEKREAKKAAAQ